MDVYCICCEFFLVVPEDPIHLQLGPHETGGFSECNISFTRPLPDGLVPYLSNEKRGPVCLGDVLGMKYYPVMF